MLLEGHTLHSKNLCCPATLAVFLLEPLGLGSASQLTVVPPERTRPPARQALGCRAPLSLHPAPQPAGEGRPGTAEARARPGSRGRGAARGPPTATAFASPLVRGQAARTLGALRPRANLVPQELSRRLARRDRKCCSVWDAAVHYNDVWGRLCSTDRR